MRPRRAVVSAKIIHKLTPGITFAQGGDVCYVVAAVPGIKREGLVERHCLVMLGVEEFALPIRGGERP